MKKARQLSWVYDLYSFGQSQLLRENPAQAHLRILQHVVDGFGADSGLLALCRDSRTLTIVAEAGLPVSHVGQDVPIGEGVPGWVAMEGKMLLLDGDIDTEPDFSHRIVTPGSGAPVSVVCWPLKGEQRLIGTLSIHRSQGLFTEDELKLDTVIVNLISIVLENAQLHADQQRQIRMLQLLNEQNQETNRRLEEAHARRIETDERLNSILSSLDDAVWSVLPETFQTVYMSQAAEKVYGRQAEEFYRTPNLWLDSVHELDRERIAKTMSSLYEKGVLDLNYRITRPDGQMRWIHDHVRVIADAEGKPVRLDGIAVDITQHKLAEEELKKSHEELKEAYQRLQEIQGQLLQSEKMASIGQLAAGVAHEINNPIGYVYSNLGTLQKYLEKLFAVVDAYEKLEPLLASHAAELGVVRAVRQEADLDFLKEDVIDLMNESREGITRVKKIVQDLKDFSHVGAEDEWQWTDLRRGLDSTLNIVRNEIKYKAEVVKEYGDMPEVECLPSQLNQVFMNLLVNAAHAIEDKGKITVRTGTQGEMVWVEISDTGKGVPAENLDRIFDPFFTTKPIGQGTGLGLSVSYSIIQKHHGNFNVASEVGQGTTFRITLPTKQPENTQAS